jgi:hypothetical protein
MKDKIKIYVVTHKEFNPPKDKIYVPIQVGKLFTHQSLRFIGDDTGHNITHKNKNYCELTALYWIWKNDSSSIVGLCHYRRYFSKSFIFSNERFFLTKNDIKQLLSDYQAIVPEYTKLPCTVREFYSKFSGKDKDILTLKTIIKDCYPTYMEALNCVLYDTKAYYCNMLICKKKYLNQYCEWMFNIMNRIESVTDLSNYTVQEARIFGYLSEILLNVWIKHNDLRIIHIPVINTETSLKYRISQRIKQIFHNI